MMRTVKNLLTVLLLLHAFFAVSQKYPRNYFRYPLDIQPVLAGTFGELRSGHFHAGLDIKTEGVVGKKVHAAAGGYVSRIKISPWGYGKALYVKHPNGYTTVYAHLLKLNGMLDSLIHVVQYARKSYAVDYYPPAGRFPVKKGEVLAYSGNSGSSGGPHLHFEIRDARQRPINPLLFGFTVPDNMKPELKTLRLYWHDEGYSRKNYIEFNKKDISKLSNDTLTVASPFYIGIESIDKLNGAPNKNGLYSYAIYLDKHQKFAFVAGKLDFSEKRYINAYIDYGTWYEERQRFQTSRILPGNKLTTVYRGVEDSGYIFIRDSLAHRLDIVLSDYAGNTRKVSFYVKKGIIPQTFAYRIPPNTRYDYINTFETDRASIKIPVGALYSNIYFNIKELDNPWTPWSPLVRLGSPDIPVHKYMLLKIKADSSLKPRWQSKAAIASLTKDRTIYYEGGEYRKGYVETKTRSFGDYFIVVDTVPPLITPVNVYNGKAISHGATMRFKIQDELSGIKSYRGSADGHWVLGEYDPKKSLLSFTLDEHYPNKDFVFKLEVSDDKGNRSVKSYRIKR